MNDLNTLFSKFSSNRIKHGQIYNFTIQKYDQVEDDTEELDFNKEFGDEDDDELFDEDFESSNEENSEEGHEVQKKCINNYFSALREQMTSTPIYPEKIDTKITVIEGMSPFTSNINQKYKKYAKQSENFTSTPIVSHTPGSKTSIPILNGITPIVANKKIEPKSVNRPQNGILTTILERNHLNKISSMTKENDKNDSVILCKPRDKENFEPVNEIELDKPRPQKLDFSFDVSDDEDDNKKLPQKLTELVPQSQNLNISNLSIPSPNDKLKQICNRFKDANQNNANNDTFLRKLHPDLNMSPVLSPNDRIKMVCQRFSQLNSPSSKIQKSPSTNINMDNLKNKKDELFKKMFQGFDTKSSANNDSMNSVKSGQKINTESDVDKIQKSPPIPIISSNNLSDKNADSLKKMCQNFGGVMVKNINLEKSTKSESFCKNNEKGNKKFETNSSLDDDDDDEDTLGELYENFPNKKSKMAQSTPLLDQNNKKQNRGLEMSKLPLATPNQKMKQLANDLENKKDDFIDKKLSSCVKSKSDPDEQSDGDDETLDEFFKKYTKNNKFQSTPLVTQGNKKEPETLELSKISKATPDDNDDDLITIECEDESKKPDQSKQNSSCDTVNKLSPPIVNSDNSRNKKTDLLKKMLQRVVGEDLTSKKTDPKKTQNDKQKEKNHDRSQNSTRENEVIVIDWQEKRDMEARKLDEKNSKNGKNSVDVFKKPDGTVVQKRAEKRLYLNRSNISIDSNRPDFKKICIEKFQQNSLQNSVQSETNQTKIYLNASKTALDSDRPDFRKICKDKFLNRTEKNDNGKKMVISQASFSSSSSSQTRIDPMKNMLKKNTLLSNFKT